MAARDAGSRTHDLVLFGATGFTGGLVADYLAEHAPAGTRWAVAGRSEDKLRAVVDRIAAAHPGADAPDVVVADSTDPASLDRLAAGTRVVITTVGPYLEYGEPLVAACARAGTDYVDLCGEPQFVDEMYLKHQQEAEASGARLVHACGFDSVPHDMGVYYTVRQLPEGVAVHMTGGVHANAQFSGGTLHSAMGQFTSLREAATTAKLRRREQGRPEGRSIRSATGRPHKDPVLGRWLVPLPTIDPQIVLRSAAALDSYGPDFSYGHYLSLRTAAQAAAAVAAIAGLTGGALIPPVRNRLLDRFARGEGPSEERRARSSFDVTFVALAGGRTVVTRVSGGDPGYTETAKMLAESALSLAFDDNPQTAGQVTTAVAMGDALLARLQAAGMTFEVV